MKEETKKSVRHVSGLAKLELDEARLDKFAEQAEKVIDYFNKLNELDTGQIPPTSHTIDVVSNLREDQVIRFQDVDKIMEQVPEKEGPFTQVPKVI